MNKMIFSLLSVLLFSVSFSRTLKKKPLLFNYKTLKTLFLNQKGRVWKKTCKSVVNSSKFN